MPEIGNSGLRRLCKQTLLRIFTNYVSTPKFFCLVNSSQIYGGFFGLKNRKAACFGYFLLIVPYLWDLHTYKIIFAFSPANLFSVTLILKPAEEPGKVAGKFLSFLTYEWILWKKFIFLSIYKSLSYL